MYLLKHDAAMQQFVQQCLAFAQRFFCCDCCRVVSTFGNT